MRMMLSVYKKMYDNMKCNYPDDYTRIITNQITSLIEFYENYESLAIVEILNNLYNYRLDPVNLDVFHDIYEKYGETKFLVEHLQSDDCKFIRERYVQEIKILGKEYDCVI